MIGGMKRFGWIECELGSLRAEGLVRDPGDLVLRQSVVAAAGALGVPFVDASSNDYLGYCSGDGVEGTRGTIGNFDGDGSYGFSESGGDQEAHLVSRETLDSLDNRTVDTPTNDGNGPAASTSTRTWTGAGASRLLGGTHREHEDLEAALANWVGHQQSLLFSSG